MSQSKIIAAYTEAFQKHYPNTPVKIERAGGKDKGKYHVVIGGDNGGMALSLSDMSEAIANFNR